MRRSLKLLGITWPLLIAACVIPASSDEDTPVDAAFIDAAIDAPVDARIDAPIDADDRIPRPPLPMPSPCDTCVGFGCDSVCIDAGVDAN